MICLQVFPGLAGVVGAGRYGDGVWSSVMSSGCEGGVQLFKLAALGLEFCSLSSW